MRRFRAALLLSFTALLTLAFTVTRSSANPETIRLIVPGVWFREGDFEQIHCNNIIIEMKDYMIVVDANFPAGARSALEDVRRISRKPVKYVFDTHHHGDHLYGNPIWTAAGATTVAFPQVAEELKRVEPARWLEEAKHRPDVAELHRDGPEPPKEEITGAERVISDGSRRVELRYFGWAHTRGDGFVYLPKEQVLCTGDAVVNGPYNSTVDAHIANWPTVLRAAGKLKIKHVLPGHGLPGGRELIAGQEQFFVELHKAVQEGIAAGKKLEELQAQVKLPASVEEWVSEASLPHQIADTHLELTKGKPRGAIEQ